jgi:hypothetical protein
MAASSVAFVRFLRVLMTTARSIRQKWSTGDTSLWYPPGLYLPSMPKLANVLP